MTAVPVSAQSKPLAPFAVMGSGGSDFTFSAMTTAGNTFVCTGRELVIIYNSSVATPRTLTITSVDDETNRTADVSDYLAAGDYAVYGVGLTNSKGWMSGAKTVLFTASHAELKMAVLRLPAGYP